MGHPIPVDRDGGQRTTPSPEKPPPPCVLTRLHVQTVRAAVRGLQRRRGHVPSAAGDPRRSGGDSKIACSLVASNERLTTPLAMTR